MRHRILRRLAELGVGFALLLVIAIPFRSPHALMIESGAVAVFFLSLYIARRVSRVQKEDPESRDLDR